jgi:enamine deaminase RidA (YjgF/YER057c/UK114 family)
MEKTHIGLGEGRPNVGMSAAVRFGDCIVVSGQVATNEQGALVGEGDFEAQAEQCFAKLADILGQAGATMADVVSLTTYLTAAENASKFLALRAKHFPERAPATTTVLAQLLSPRFLIEIQAMAVVSG